MEKTPFEVEVTTQPCIRCGKTSTLVVSKVGLEKWQAGASVQRAFPDLDAGTREMLMTGTHPVCWDEMWKDVDE